MNQVRAKLTIEDQAISFRIDGRLHPIRFDTLMKSFKQDFPARKWSGEAWELPRHYLKPAYEFWRDRLGVENVSIEFHNSKSEEGNVQMSLFN